MRKLAFLAVALVTAAILSSHTFAQDRTCAVPSSVVSTGPQFSGGAPNESYQIMYHRVWEYIRDFYYDPARLKDWDAMETKFADKLSNIDDLHLALEELTRAAGDKWTNYRSPARIAEMANQRNMGLKTSGLDLEKNNGSQYQIDVIHYKSPAFGTALSERDFVRCIDGTAIATLPKERVDEMLRARVGAKMTITAVSGRDGSEYEVELTFAETPDNVVESRYLGDGIVYIRLPSYDGETYMVEFMEHFAKVKRESGQVKGIVLDLRNNTGGDLPAAVKFASMFIPDDSAVVVKSMKRAGPGLAVTDVKVVPVKDITFNRAAVDPELVKVLKSAPVVVLVNGSTASASEVTVGALKDNKRATILGVRTFGKGVGYRGMPGPIGGAVTVTGLKYQTPDGHEVHERGIAPDVTVPAGAKGDPQLDAAVLLLKK